MGIISINEEVCLNYNYKKNGCRNCRDCCPQKCWNESGNIDANRCNSCGLCQSACPVDAIGVEGISASSWVESTRSKEREKHFSCSRYGVGPWSCLGFLTARDMIAFALNCSEKESTDVVIHDIKCQQCNPPVAIHLEREITVAGTFLSAFCKSKVLHGKNDYSAKGKETKLDRRAFFGSLLKAGTQTARNVIWPGDAVTPLPKNVWRQQVLQNIDWPQGEQSAFPVLSIKDESCIACGMCAKICPTNAITSFAGETGLELRHAPFACTGCGLCLEHCPEGAIAFERTGSTIPYVLISKDFPRCNECGSLFQPAGKQLTCFECLMKGCRSIFEP